ncbi:MAG: O-antigen ligase family protein [Nitrospirae bacterium]|nr:O-antigen ligase family protein [Nitrospirota bacterium]
MDLLRKINPDSLIMAGCAGLFFSVPVATSPAVVCGVFVLAVWIVSGRFLRDVISWRSSGLILPVAALILLPWTGLIYSQAPEHGFPVALKTHYWLYALAIGPSLRMQKTPDLIIRMFLAGLSVNSCLSIVQFSGLIPLKKGLATGLLGGSSAHISYSLLLSAGILVASFYFLRSGTVRGRLLSGLLMLQYFITIGFIGGRSGYIALIILSPLVVRNITGRRHILKILLVSAIGISFLFASPVVRSRFMKAGEDIAQYKQGNVNTSLGLRFHMWGIALTEIRKNPLLGIGTGGFRRSWEMYKKEPSLPFFDHPHNSFLYMAVSFGIIGLIAFCRLLAVMLERGWKGRDSALGFSVLAFTSVFIIGSLTDTQVLPFATAISLPLFAGVSEAIDVA